MECDHQLSLIDTKTGHVKCFVCGKVIDEPTGRAKILSDLITKVKK